MKRKILLILLAACLGLTACQGQSQPGTNPSAPAPGNQPTPAEQPAPTGETASELTEGQLDEAATEPAPSVPVPVVPDLPAAEGLGFNSLDGKLIAFLKDNGKENESFTVSPLSFKAALALTALGAEGETQSQILDALGFETVQEMCDWYDSVLVGTADFDGRIMGQDKADTAYRIVNAIFQNADCDGEFQESYKELVAKTLAAQANAAPAGELTEAINHWVNDQTNGMIPNLVQDASQAASVLVNALYLKTKWIEPFHESEMTSFTTAAGNAVQKEFIQKTEKFRYFEDEGCQMVVIPLQGGIQMALVLGDGSDLAGKLENAEYRKVHVSLPKFEVETSLDDKELVRYLQAVGCERMFADGGVAQFDPMFTKEIYVDDIIQKAKVKVDENGLEAAAATAVIMVRATAMPNPEQPVEFIADHPFQFVIFREDAAPELLFWGQIVD